MSSSRNMKKVKLSKLTLSPSEDVNIFIPSELLEHEWRALQKHHILPLESDITYQSGCRVNHYPYDHFEDFFIDILEEEKERECTCTQLCSDAGRSLDIERAQGPLSPQDMYFLGTCAYTIPDSIPRAKEWFKACSYISTGEYHDRSQLALAALSNITDSHDFEKDETFFRLRWMKGYRTTWDGLGVHTFPPEPCAPHVDIHSNSKYRLIRTGLCRTEVFSSNSMSVTSHSDRHLVRTLLSGHLSKNRTSALHRSFFKSPIREAQLLPTIVRYILSTKIEYSPNRYSRYRDSTVDVESYDNISSFILSGGASSISSLTLHLRGDMQYLGILRYLSFNSSILHTLRIQHHNPYSYPVGMVVHPDLLPQIDLSFLRGMTTCNLKTLMFGDVYISSLSPLSQCYFDSLERLYLGIPPISTDDILYGEYSEPGCHPNYNNLQVYSLTSLSGIGCYHFSLKHIYISCPSLVDISALSELDASILEEVSFPYCRKIVDFSVFDELAVPQLSLLDLTGTGLSDLFDIAEMTQLYVEDEDEKKRKYMVVEELIVKVTDTPWDTQIQNSLYEVDHEIKDPYERNRKKLKQQLYRTRVGGDLPSFMYIWDHDDQGVEDERRNTVIRNGPRIHYI